jgi:hypothetical protein
MRRSLPFLQAITAVLISALGVSCQQTARMGLAEKAFVKTEISKLEGGGVRVMMKGDELLNPTAALERFHEIAVKQLAGVAYSYGYQIDKADVTEVHYRTEKVEREVAAPRTGGGYAYTPIYNVGSGGGGGVGGGEAALIVASAIVLALLIKAASDSVENKKSVAQAGALEKPKMVTVTDTKMVKEQRVVGQVMRLTGTAQPVARLNWPKTQPVEVIIPKTAPIIGKMSVAQAGEFAEAAAESLRSLGYTATVVSSPSASGYWVTPVVLRAQNMFEAGQQQMTVEYELSSPASRQKPARVFVQTANPFAGMSLTSDMGYQPRGLVKPLAKRLQAVF